MKGGVEIGFNGTKYRTKKCEASLISEAPALGPEEKKYGTNGMDLLLVDNGKRR
jgi:hypothetical protein